MERPPRRAANGKPASDGNPPTFERNPAADRVPELGPDDLIRLCFDDDLGGFESRKALAEMEAAGHVVIERDGAGWRIIEPRR